MSEPFVKLCAVSKRFGKIEALKGIDLQIFRDELLVVLGPTGAGKTTLLRPLVGLETPEKGRVLIEGKDSTWLAPAARDMAMVFQEFSLYPDWTVRRNLEFPLRAPGRKETASTIKERVEWAAGLLRITHLLDRPSARLSGGEMQRVAIGRAIVRRPRLFLMDEPLTNLDAKLREELRVELACLRRDLKTPMVYVTHDQAEAMSMADRIAVLSRGEILQTGTPQEIYRSPVNPEVACQLGQPKINIIPVQLSGLNWAVESGACICPADNPTEDRMLLGVRPEDIQPQGGNYSGIIEVVEDMGPIKILLVKWIGIEIHLTVPKTYDCRPGDVVFPKVDASKVVLWKLTPGDR